MSMTGMSLSANCVRNLLVAGGILCTLAEAAVAWDRCSGYCKYINDVPNSAGGRTVTVTLDALAEGSHYNVSVGGGRQFELRPSSTAGSTFSFLTFSFDVPSNAASAQFSLQHCSRAFPFASNCTSWDSYSHSYAAQYPAKPVRRLGKRPPPPSPAEQFAVQSRPLGNVPVAAPPQESFVTVALDTDVYNAPGGNGQRTGMLRAGTPQVKLVEPCNDSWCHLNWAAGQGWVYSGPGHESLRFP